MPKKQRNHADILDWEELAEAPNTRGAFSFLRPQASVVDIEQHRPRELQIPPVVEEVMSSSSHPHTPSAKARPYRIHRCYRAQDGHSNGENQLYLALWQAGSMEETETKRLTIGWDRMGSLAGMSDKSARRNLKKLKEKLAIEVIAKENSATRTGTTYRVFSYKAILERRRAAGMTFVTKDKGVRFVAPPTHGSEGVMATAKHPVRDKTSTVDIMTTVDKTSTGTVDITTTDTVDVMSIPLGSILESNTSKTTTTRENLDPIVHAIAEYVVADEDAAQSLLLACRKVCSTATVEEVASVIALKAPGVVRNRSINNPLGLLITSVPQCFRGVGIDRLRAEWEAEKRRKIELEQERIRQHAEMNAWVDQEARKYRAVIDDNASTDEAKIKAQKKLADLEPFLQHLQDGHEPIFT